MDKKPTQAIIKTIIEHSKEPLLFSNLNDNWSTWTLKTWENQFQNMKLPFRKGKYYEKIGDSEQPQWERTTEIIEMTFCEFLKCNEQSANWYYFDYKRLPELFDENSEIFKKVSWAEFGYPSVTAVDSNIWIGNKGAHTPCHVDTYESNLILQIFGEKKWLLFPPNTQHLKPTRIPYEESSIYSEINFFKPDVSLSKNLEGAREIVLKPGNVLFVPQGWWHYVENLSIAISLNAWLPTNDNNESHLHEAIVQLFAAVFVKNLPKEQYKLFLNPNNDDIVNLPFKQLLEQIYHFIPNEQSTEEPSEHLHKKIKLDSTNEISPKELISKYSKFVQIVPILSNEEFENFLMQQQNNHGRDQRQESTKSVPVVGESNKDTKFVKTLLNILCSSEVIELISKKLRTEK